MPNANDSVIVTTRIFEAPRELVFAAFSDQRHLARWWGPDGFSTTTSRFEFREGGIWRFVMHGPDGRDYENCITFDEITPPERLVYHHGGDDTIENLCFGTIVLFEDLGGRTRLTMEMSFPTLEQRDDAIRLYKADEGAEQHLRCLGEFLAADFFRSPAA